jgi:hypothetical protein
MAWRQGPETLRAALAAPFAASEVLFRALVVSGHRALALPYVDVRTVEDRLDRVLGLDGWQDHYLPLDDGCVVCALRVRFGEEWLAKCDVGCPGAWPDVGDRRKTAFSDALKRAARKWGVGRYLGRVPPHWADYDPVTGRFVTPVRLPAWALPVDPGADAVSAGAGHDGEGTRAS